MVSEVGSRKQRLAFHTAYCFNISCSLLVACQMGGILASSSLLPQNYPSPSPKVGLLQPTYLSRLDCILDELQIVTQTLYF